MKLPKSIVKIIGERPYSVENIGMSNAQVICFDDMVLKIGQQLEESDQEYQMMKWLTNKLPVPKIICFKQENGINYLLMSKIKGDISCSNEMLENPKQLVKLLAEGLRMLWDIDISTCPFHNSIDHQLKLGEIRLSNNPSFAKDTVKDKWGENGFETNEQLLQWLKDNKPNEEFVFSHGDYCLPNIFIKDNKISGFIDLGGSGIADKYLDIAFCYRSLKHNFDGTYGGKVYEDFDPGILFDELNIVPDWEKIRYYILLDEMVY